jgi:hypothetical protein
MCNVPFRSEKRQQQQITFDTSVSHRNTATPQHHNATQYQQHNIKQPLTTHLLELTTLSNAKH